MIESRVMNNIVYKRSKDKDRRLREVRGFGFDSICDAIERGDILANIPHPNQIQYPHQYKLIVKIANYAYDVPYVLEGSAVYFFKTAMPSRRSTKEYILSVT